MKVTKIEKQVTLNVEMSKLEAKFIRMIIGYMNHQDIEHFNKNALEKLSVDELSITLNEHLNVEIYNVLGKALGN